MLLSQGPHEPNELIPNKSKNGPKERLLFQTSGLFVNFLYLSFCNKGGVVLGTVGNTC